MSRERRRCGCGPHSRSQQQRRGDDTYRRQVAQPAAEQERPGGVSESGHQHRSDSPAVDITQLQTDERRHTGKPDQQPKQPSPVEHLTRADHA